MGSKEDTAPSARDVEGMLPEETRTRLNRLVDEGTVRAGDFDAESLLKLTALPEALQDRVMNYMETDRVFLINSRSKSGFLVAAVDRARNGCIDVLGLGTPDPWKEYLNALATPKRTLIDLVPEDVWLAQNPGFVRMTLNVSADEGLGVSTVTLGMAPTRTVLDVKQLLARLGVTIPERKMRLREQRLGVLRDDRTLAFYNMPEECSLQLVRQQRGGVRLRKDQSVPLALQRKHH